MAVNPDHMTGAEDVADQQRRGMIDTIFIMYSTDVNDDGRDVAIYEAWEEATYASHTAVRGRVGDLPPVALVTKRHLPPEIETLPGGSEERIGAVLLYQAKLSAVAFNAIVAEYPELKTDPRARFIRGRFEVTL